MTIQELKAAHDKFVSDGIATFVPAVKKYLAAVDEYLNSNVPDAEPASKTPSASA